MPLCVLVILEIENGLVILFCTLKYSSFLPEMRFIYVGWAFVRSPDSALHRPSDTNSTNISGLRSVRFENSCTN